MMQDNHRLPILDFEKPIIQMIANERVSIISGRTGCGKSTQVPQIIFNAVPNAKIAICQPRRLAATSLAARVSSEMKSKIGNLVGYHIGMDPKMCQKTKIIFMTYGILIQELLFNRAIGYTHIILDEVHERSLEMDFAFIALKKILDQQKRKHIKIIIMSATINSKEFKRYFSTHKENNSFMKPSIKFYFQKELDYAQKKRGNKNRSEYYSNTLRAEKTFTSQNEYTESADLNIPDKKFYTTEIFYADELVAEKYKQIYLKQFEDVKISDNGYQIVCELISKFYRNEEGDILIFVPGMIEIKRLRQELIKQNHGFEEKIVQVHSAFSDELYYKLFVEKIKNKIIIATNIGQSSITLPQCKLVIDFCLNRKNMSAQGRGYTKFCTQIASKSNLIQRAGRVGRVSNGIVYRLISKKEMQDLLEFQKPEIQCVSLEMVILNIKQLDKTYKSSIFEDPYDFIISTIEPPNPDQVQKSLQFLIKEKALEYEQKITDNQIYKGKKLKLTKIGEFMVSMPCNFGVSKMILLSIQLGIENIVIDIGSIMMSTKHFYVAEDKRKDIQKWIHNLVTYDQGNFNDYSLKQRIFAHWKESIFLPFKQHYNARQKDPQRQYDQDQLNSYSENLVESFSSMKVQQSQWNWLFKRGIYPNTMRDILRISQSIRNRLRKLKIQVKVQNQEPPNELILLCLMLAFQTTTCTIEWEGKVSRTRQTVVLRANKRMSSKYIKESLPEYLHPQKDYRIEEVDEETLEVVGSPSVLVKLFLPQFYTKAELNECSPFFKHLTSGKNVNCYCLVGNTIFKNRGVYVLNDSINKLCLKMNPKEDYLLISHSIFKSKEKLYMNSSAMINFHKYLIIKMMTNERVSLKLHCSKQFFNYIKFDGSPMKFPLLLTNKNIKDILKIRKYALWEKQSSIEGELKPKFRKKILEMINSLKFRPEEEKWEQIFNQSIEGSKEDPQYYPIQKLPQLLEDQHPFYERYRKWKKKQHRNMYFNYKIYTIFNPILICAQCYDYLVTEIEDLDAFNTNTGHMKLNEFSGSWKRHQNMICCKFDHQVGKAIDDDFAVLFEKNVLVYTPFNKVHEFTGKKEDFQMIKAKGIQQQKKLHKMRNELQGFECIICSYFDDQEDKVKFEIIQNQEEYSSGPFWKKVSKHMNSKKHIDNTAQFMKSV